MADDTEHPIHVAARSIADWAYTDSLVQLDRAKLRALLADDSEQCGYLPDDDECMQFVCGDDSGTPPAKLVADFPKTNAYLEQFWA